MEVRTVMTLVGVYGDWMNRAWVKLPGFFPVVFYFLVWVLVTRVYSVCTSVLLSLFFFKHTWIKLKNWAWRNSFPCYSGILLPKFIQILCLETTTISSFFWNPFGIVYEDKSSKYCHVSVLILFTYYALELHSILEGKELPHFFPKASTAGVWDLASLLLMDREVPLVFCYYKHCCSDSPCMLVILHLWSQLISNTELQS